MRETLNGLNKFLKYLLILFFPALSYGQDLDRFIALDNLKNAKRVKYFLDDKIRIELKNKTRLSGNIEKISDSSFVVKNAEIFIKEVAAIYKDRSNFVTHGFTILFAGWGAGFIAIDTFNNLTNGEKPIIKKRALIAGAALISAAGIIKLLSVKKYKIKGDRVLRIVNTSPV